MNEAGINNVCLGPCEDSSTRSESIELFILRQSCTNFFVFVRCVHVPLLVNLILTLGYYK